MNERADHAIAVAKPYSKCSVARLLATWTALETVDRNGIDGAFVECGVWRGGNIMVARMASPHRQCWLYDTYQNMPEPGPLDKRRSGETVSKKEFAHRTQKGGKWYGIPVDEVKNNLISKNVYDDKLVRFVIGDVCQTLKVDINLPDAIAVLRLDTDWYESTKVEMEILYPRLSVGGMLILDDYGHWMGMRKAVDDYLGASCNQLKQIDYAGYWMSKDGASVARPQ